MPAQQIQYSIVPKFAFKQSRYILDYMLGG